MSKDKNKFVVVVKVLNVGLINEKKKRQGRSRDKVNGRGVWVRNDGLSNANKTADFDNSSPSHSDVVPVMINVVRVTFFFLQ